MSTVFIPFSEELHQELGAVGELVPFQLGYECLRLKDGTYEFAPLRTGRAPQQDREAA